MQRAERLTDLIAQPPSLQITYLLRGVPANTQEERERWGLYAFNIRYSIYTLAGQLFEKCGLERGPCSEALCALPLEHTLLFDTPEGWAELARMIAPVAAVNFKPTVH